MTALDSVRSDWTLLNLRRVLSFTLILFLTSCVFDPADKMLGLKVQLFLMCWFLTVVSCAVSRDRCRIHAGLLTYTLLFVLVPVLSIAWYWTVNGSEPFEGFQLLKGYLLITLAALLFITRIDLLPYLSAVLTVLAMAIIVVFIGLVIQPEFVPVLLVFGERTGTVVVDNRDYGSGLILLQVYFVTSPMLALPIAHYFHAAKAATDRGRKLLYGVLTLINACAMLLAGTRNNMAVSLLLPLALLFLYSKHKLGNALFALGLLALLVALFVDQLLVLLDPSEFSNSLKLMLLDDYGRIFADPMSFLFGQGLGAYHYWDARGQYFYVSELTYLELIRNFGVFGGMFMLGLLLFPLLYALILKRSFSEKHIIVGYAFYLLMCASNPNLFSSMGILILSIVLANIFLFDSRHRAAKGSAST